MNVLLCVYVDELDQLDQISSELWEFCRIQVR